MESHHHHHVSSPLASEDEFRVVVLSIGLNLLYVVIEAVAGFWNQSLGLLSDAGHNLGDVFSLLLVALAFVLAKTAGKKRYSYGYRKGTILISLANSLILMVAVGAILVESIHKLLHPDVTNGMAVFWTALAGILVNGLTALMLRMNGSGDLNMRVAFLHMFSDALVSLGVALSGVVIFLTGITWLDPLVGILVALFIIVSSWKLLWESLRLSMDAVPRNVDMDALLERIRSMEHVTDVHHIHVWALSTRQNALTAHLVLDDLSCMDTLRGNVRAALEEWNITHVTLEMETAGSSCQERDCC